MRLFQENRSVRQFLIAWPWTIRGSDAGDGVSNKNGSFCSGRGRVIRGRVWNLTI